MNEDSLGYPGWRVAGMEFSLASVLAYWFSVLLKPLEELEKRPWRR